MLRLLVSASLAVALSAASAFAQSPGVDPEILPVVYTVVVVPPEKRPASLLPLYATQGVLHGLDLYSTFRGIGNGRVREANPLLKSASRPLMIGVKAGAAAASIFATEKLWKKHPKLAVATMVAINAVLSGVILNNFRLGS